MKLVLSKADIDFVMERITNTLSNASNGMLKKILLYGSYARGDFKDYSDVDIMVLVDEPNPNNIYSIIKPEVDFFSDEYLIMVSCHFQNYNHFYEAMEFTSFYKNIEREGIVYYEFEKRD